MSVDDTPQSPAERKSAIKKRHEQAATEVLPDHRDLYIGGEWVQSASGETFQTTDPTTGETLAEVQAGNADDIDHAVDAAWEAYDEVYSSYSSADRQAMLEAIADRLNEHGFDAEVKPEYTTQYNDESGQDKTVDFALFEGEALKVVFEANCYKGGGSKPSEIRRSYNFVADRMRRDAVEFVWITDGQGWEKSLTNVLRQSYDDIVDVYNLHQVETELGDDIRALLNGQDAHQ